MKRIDLTGQRFERLVVIEAAPSYTSGKARWRCRCDCGKEKTISGRQLRIGGTKSCGCLKTERITKLGLANRKYPKREIKHNEWHGWSHTPEYQAFVDAKMRCTNPNSKAWKDYGARGIRFLFESFSQFIAELGPRTTPEHQLDRIDNDGNYEPGNVRWATREVQLANKRNSGIRNSVGRFSAKSVPIPPLCEIMAG